MFVLCVVFPVGGKKKKREKKSTESLTHGKIHPLGRAAKWSLLELISPHLLLFNSAITVHWNSSALSLEIKTLLDNNWSVFSLWLSEGGWLHLLNSSRSKPERILLGCIGKGGLLVTQVLLRVKLGIYSFLWQTLSECHHTDTHPQ